MFGLSTPGTESSKVALIIGVDEYYHIGTDGNPSLPRLLSCRKDATDLYDLLSSDKLGYEIFGKSPLIGTNLDKEFGYTTINKAITNFFLDAEPGQTVLFYFSGHGVPWAGDVYLASPQADPKRPSIAGFSLSNLSKIIESCRSTRIVCIIDACYSGAANLPNSTRGIDKAAAEGEAELALGAYDNILNIPKAEGKCLLLSSQAYEKSRALDNSNSVYTKYVIEGLRGVKASLDEKGRHIPSSFDSNGNVTPESLHEYVYLRVANEVKQTPKIKSDKSSKIILAEYPQLALLKLSDNEMMLKLLQQNNIADFNKRRQEDPYKSLDLHQANLKGANLKGANLKGANLKGANLKGAELSEANLEGAAFGGAILEEANIRGANLYKANFIEAKLADTVKSFVKPFRERFEVANLRKADLSGAYLSEADLAGAELQGAILEGANLKDAHLYHASLIEAKLGRAILEGAYLNWAKLERADLHEAQLSNANFEDADFAEANLEEAKLLQASLANCFLFGANLRKADLRGADLEGADLEEADLEGAQLFEANLEGANLNSANLNHTKNLPISLEEAKSRGASI